MEWLDRFEQRSYLLIGIQNTHYMKQIAFSQSKQSQHFPWARTIFIPGLFSLTVALDPVLRGNCPGKLPGWKCIEQRSESQKKGVDPSSTRAVIGCDSVNWPL
jgi:hypothetical protein